MCGICGFSGAKGKVLNQDKIKLLLLANQERGKDSLGYFTPTGGIVKELGKADEVMSKKDFAIPESNLFIGHIRAATIGFVNKDNAHPFHYGNVVLAMNGTLSNHWDLCRAYKLDWSKFDVDSQVLAAMLNIDQSKESLTKILGGCAILYTDTNTNKLYCYRNSDRPLYRGALDDCIYISSIESSLKVIGCTNVKEFKQDILYEIQDGVILQHSKVKRAAEEVIDKINKSYNKINMSDTLNQELVGMFLEPDRNFWENAKFFEKGRFYEVVDASDLNIYDIGVVHGDSYIKVSKHRFSEHLPIIGIQDYVIGLHKILYNKSNIVAGEVNDMYIIMAVQKNGETLTCRNLKTGKIVTVPESLMRYAGSLEVEDYRKANTILSACNNNSCNLPTTTVPPQKEEDIFRKQLLEQKYTSKEELTESTLVEILDQITDLEEVTFNKVQLTKIDNIKALIGNYSIKSENFKKEMTNAD